MVVPALRATTFILEGSYEALDNSNAAVFTYGVVAKPNPPFSAPSLEPIAEELLALIAYQCVGPSISVGDIRLISGT